MYSRKVGNGMKFEEDMSEEDLELFGDDDAMDARIPVISDISDMLDGTDAYLSDHEDDPDRENLTDTVRLFAMLGALFGIGVTVATCFSIRLIRKFAQRQ